MLIIASNGWDADCSMKFNLIDVECILGKELRGEEAQDEVTWHYERRERFLECPVDGCKFAKRGIRVDEGCPSCAEDFEDIRHALLLCSLSRLAWADLANMGDSMETWMRGVNQEFRGGGFRSLPVDLLDVMVASEQTSSRRAGNGGT
ncbi:hypothetical protein Salat_0071900 [Sesamum alatum]|uniref:Reverse transcriptase zinc-binding domain-containing protein n=1 Tax=Sesamum alatum TaxID=300844 RepID=A0AAE1YVL0_9LAMI|nr:hypothetical protein Salat_0071900 [Sesamum alatum]